MSDTIYDNGKISFARFFGGDKGDCVQVSLGTELYEQMPLEEFRGIYKAIEQSVLDNQHAWWHNLIIKPKYK